MRQGFCLCLSFLLFLTIPALDAASGGTPTEQIKTTTEKILAVVSSPELKEPAMADERRRRIRAAVDERFDWEEIASRALARHWRERTEKERQEFIELFGELLERTYLKKVEGYGGEKVSYDGERIDGEYAEVIVKILTLKGTEIPVEYRVKKQGDDWLVYDIVIQGVSLVKNYRTQFNDIINRSSYDELVKKLRTKVEPAQ